MSKFLILEDVPIITKNLKIRENLRIIDNTDFQSYKMNI